MSQKLGRTIDDSRDAMIPASLVEIKRVPMNYTDHNAAGESMIDLPHELRTTLAIIMLSSGNLELLYDRLNDEQRIKMIREIRLHAQRMNEFLEDVLSLCDSVKVTAM